MPSFLDFPNRSGYSTNRESRPDHPAPEASGVCTPLVLKVFRYRIRDFFA